MISFEILNRDGTITQLAKYDVMKERLKEIHENDFALNIAPKLSDYIKDNPILLHNQQVKKFDIKKISDKLDFNCKVILSEFKMKCENLIKKTLSPFESISSLNASYIAHRNNTDKKLWTKLEKSLDWSGSIATSLIHLIGNLFQTIVTAPIALFSKSSRESIKIYGKRMKHDVMAFGIGFVGIFSNNTAAKLCDKAGMTFFKDLSDTSSADKKSQNDYKNQAYQTLSNIDASFIIDDNSMPNRFCKIMDQSVNWTNSILTSMIHLTTNLFQTIISAPTAIFNQDSRVNLQIHGTRSGYDILSFAKGFVGVFSQATASKMHRYFERKIECQ